MPSIPDPSFAGAVVVLFESRLAAETAAMVRRFGGTPVTAPALAEVEVDADAGIGALIDRLASPAGSIVVFLTGVAVTRLFAAAERAGRADALAGGLRRAVTVARGPKPAGALGRRGVTPTHAVAEPFTTDSVIDALARIEVDGRDVTLVHYGERNEPILAHLSDRGARVHELLLYEWRLPEDTAPLSDAVDRIAGGQADVAVFTSQIQVRHLLDVAGPSRRGALVEAMNGRVLVGAVGPTCAAACRDAGIADVVTPASPKLAPLITALATAYAARRAR